MSLTVLYAPEVIAAKGNGAIRLGYSLYYDIIPLDSFGSLVLALESLKSLPHAYVVRGHPRDGLPLRIRRRSKTEPFHLENVPEQWLCIDIDGRLSAVDCFAEPARAVDVIRATLPHGLSQAACYYALTGSCKAHMIHCHLWFYLDRPYSNAELLRELGGRCDTSLYKPTQPHFTAAPRIVPDAIADKRRGILDGGIGWLGKEPLKADPIAAEEQLKASMAEVAAQTKGNRHMAVNRRAYYMGRHVAVGAIERLRVIETLVTAAQAAGLDDERARNETCRGLADGIRDAPNREQWLDRLEHNKDGVPRSTYLNAIISLSESAEWAGCLGWSERHSRTEWLRNPPVGGGFGTARQGAPFREEHAAIAAEWLASHGLSYARNSLIDAMIDASHKHPFDPLKDRLDELDWDGVSRLSNVLLRYFGVPQDKAEWARGIGRRWMIAAIARVYDRGCKADNILVLEGAQGSFKSTALDILGMGYTKEIRVQLDDKDASDALHSGAWIAVLTELDAFKATYRAESVKAFLSMLEDYFRRAYGRVTLAHPRSIIFAATTNEESYLNDPTGNRRFWCITCGRIDILALRQDVEQLWAEAKQAYFDGEPWYLEGEALLEIAATEQAARLIPDTWEDYATDYLLNKSFVTLRELCLQVYQLDPVQQKQPELSRIRRYLSRMGFKTCIRNGVKGYER